MYYHRNRLAYTPEELAEVYTREYDHTRWPDHIARVEKTIEVGLAFIADLTGFLWMADLSCGDAAIALGISESRDPAYTDLYLGDYVAGREFRGPIENTLEYIPHVDLFILSETLEHVDDPEMVLHRIRRKSDRLLLTTPKMTCPDDNPEHYHSWDDEHIRGMLALTGWTPEIYEELYAGIGYTYQIFGCK